MGYPQINRHLQYTKLEDNSYEVVDILSGDVWIASKLIDDRGTNLPRESLPDILSRTRSRTNVWKCRDLLPDRS